MNIITKKIAIANEMLRYITESNVGVQYELLLDLIEPLQNPHIFFNVFLQRFFELVELFSQHVRGLLDAMGVARDGDLHWLAIGEMDAAEGQGNQKAVPAFFQDFYP